MELSSFNVLGMDWYCVCKNYGLEWDHWPFPGR